MIDADVITRRLLSLNEALQRLSEHSARLTAGALAADAMLQAAVERWLQVAVEACIDIAYHIVAERGFTPPDTARAAFETLAAHGIISVDLAANLARAAGMRNILVHEYARVDRGILVTAAREGLRDLQAFGAAAGRLIPDDTGSR